MTAPVPAPCRIVRMELAGGAAPLAIGDDRYRAVGVFFTLDGVPVGHKYLAACDLPMTADQMWEVATEAILPAVTRQLLAAGVPLHRLVSEDPLQEFRSLLRSIPAGPAADQVSVVICTRERPEALSRCLGSLQKLEEAPLETVVVDNAPGTEATRQVVAEFPGVRYRAEPRSGLSYARNTGVEASRGDIVAFTDDDVLVTGNWLRELMRPFRDPNVMCATGLVIPAEMEVPEQTLFEHWMSFQRGYAGQKFGPAWMKTFRSAPAVWDIGAGASMAIRRSAFGQHGLFDTRLGAGAAGCSEDSEFWYRLIAAGHTCEYTPRALVRHQHRANRQSLARQIRMYSRGHAAALLAQFARYRDARNLLRLAVVLPLYHLRKLGAAAVFPEPRTFMLESARGYLEGLFYLVHNPVDRSEMPVDRSVVQPAEKAIPALRGQEADGEQ
ncbi:MAG TPA: glycosyltransferase [Bryobacteraceae bacterium]|nr:glycosyltransferase [Bryobacteraceae bacterium]